MVITNVYGAATSSAASLQVASLLADSDYDGRNNGQELADGTDPFNPNSVLGVQLGNWRFDTNTWVGDQGQLPLLATNVVLVPSWNTNAVLIDSTNAAMLSYRDVETNGLANLNVRCGTVLFWFKPDWSSSNNFGTGPGDNGRLIEMGSATPSSPTNSNLLFFTNGWWSLYLTPDGNQLVFASATNGVGRTNLVAPVSFTAGLWCQLALTFTPTNSLLYANSQLLTNGLAPVYYPNLTQRAAGFHIGSDAYGWNQGRGVYDDLATFNYPLTAAAIATNYQAAINLSTVGGGLNNIEVNEMGLSADAYLPPPTPAGFVFTNGMRIYLFEPKPAAVIP